MANTSEWKVSFDSLTRDYIAPSESSDIQNDVKFLKGYNFTVPSTPSDQWKFKIELGFDFITSGSLGLIIVPNDGQAPRLCSQEEGCVMGVDDRINFNVIKTVLTQGSYTLWIYDTIGEHNSSLASCLPFSIKVDISKLVPQESFLTCPHSKLPNNLNSPGFMDTSSSGKYYFFNQPVLVSPRIDRVSFQVANTSYFRLWLNEHRLDLDAYLLDSQSNILAASYSFFQEENIAYVLQPGSYQISIVVFGAFRPTFCETYDLLFSIATVQDTVDVCHDGNGQIINNPITFPDFTQELSALQYYRFYGQNQIFSFPYEAPFIGSRVIATKNFTVTQAFNMKVSMDYNFIHGDLEFTLTNLDAASFVPLRADHHQNSMLLSKVIGAGNYSLSISTGDLQRSYNSDMISQFPPCYRYKFDIEFDPNLSLSQNSDTNCWNYLWLPDSLNTPGYLEQSSILHISEDFYIPKGSVVTREIVFTVETASFFRIYVDPNVVDVDIYLIESGVIVARAIQYNKEESIVLFLDPKEEYIIKFMFFRHEITTACETFRLELAIEPTSALESTCQGTKLPETNLIPSDPTLYPFVSEDLYYFTQSNQSFSVDLPFTIRAQNANVSDVAVIRVLSRFNFLWGHFSLYILSQDNNNQTIATGIADEASSNDLLPFNLPSGNYILRLSQPATSLQELERCVIFTLQIMIDSIAPNSIGDFGCAPSPIQATLNSAAGLNNISGQSFHVAKNSLAEIYVTYDYMDFTLTERSVLRAYVSFHPQIDIDLILTRGNHTFISEVIASSLGYEEENILKDLDAGSYSLFYRFLAFPFQSLPSMNDCPTFPTQVSIVPYAFLSTIPSISSSCSEILPPSTLVANQLETVDFQRDPSQNFQHDITFQVPSGGKVHFYAHLSFDFLSANIEMTLSDGENKIYSLIGTNRAFIDTLLNPNTWTLTLRAGSSSISNINCAKATFTYLFNTSIDPSDCEIYNKLPNSFFSQDSAEFGGPQAADGTVNIVGNYFNIPQQNVNQYISFFVTQASVLRIFTDAGQNVDLDIYVYNSTTQFTYANVVAYSIGIGPTESKQIILRPLSNGDNYTLSIHSFFVHPEVGPCNYFKFEFALEPLTKLYDQISCPITFPDPEVPPEIINFYPQSTVILNNAQYLFSHQRIHQYIQTHPGSSNEFIYTIQFVVHAPSVVSGMLSFNFLHADFNIRIMDSSYRLLTTGTLFDINERGSLFNFGSQFNTNFEPGVYYLQITEQILPEIVTTQIVDFCFPFQFYLFFMSDNANPTITTIFPSSSSEIDPVYDFVIQIGFSVPIVHPNSSEWRTFFDNETPIYLIDQQDSSTKILPFNAELRADMQTIHLTFSQGSLKFSKNYTLVIDASKFHAANNSAFTFTNATQYVYRTRDCLCNGHGSCDAQGSCQCQFPYAGPSCTACENGYHSAGTSCVQNIACQSDSCSGHGSCDDSEGYPVCTCYQGYATFSEYHCGICSTGYSGYPNCTANVNPIPAHCNAQLLPNSFDGPGYLADDGRLHIADEFFVDYKHFNHFISFSLDRDSVIRAYIEPHLVDIDLWLYQYREDGSISKVNHSNFSST